MGDSEGSASMLLFPFLFSSSSSRMRIRLGRMRYFSATPCIRRVFGEEKYRLVYAAMMRGSRRRRRRREKWIWEEGKNMFCHGGSVLLVGDGSRDRQERRERESKGKMWGAGLGYIFYLGFMLLWGLAVLLHSFAWSCCYSTEKVTKTHQVIRKIIVTSA